MGKMQTETNSTQTEMLTEKPALHSTFVDTARPFLEGVVLCVSVSENTSLMAVGKPDCLIHIYGLKLNVIGEQADWISEGDFKLTGHRVPVMRGAFSPDRQFMASWSRDLVLLLWNLKSRHCVAHSTTQMDVTRIVFDSQSLFFATIHGGGSAVIWKTNSSNSNIQLSSIRTNTYTAPLTVCAFHPEKALLVTGSVDSNVRMWLPTQPSVVRNFMGHSATVTALAFSKCAGYLIAGAADGLLIVWNVASQLVLRHLNHHTEKITSIAFAPDGGRFAVGSQDTQMSVWDFELLLLRTKDQVIRYGELLLGSRASECGMIYEVRFVSDTHLMAICVEKPNGTEPVVEPASVFFGFEEASESDEEQDTIIELRC